MPIKAPDNPCIHNHPPMRERLREDLLEVLYAPIREKQQERLNNLIVQNTGLCGYTYYTFRYRGELFGTYALAKLPPAHAPVLELRKAKEQRRQVMYEAENQRLDDSLHADMDRWLAERAELESHEEPLLRATLTSVLRITDHIDDYKRLLPQLLHDRLDEEAMRCACVTQPMPQDKFDEAIAKYGSYISVIKQRQVMYLLCPP